MAAEGRAYLDHNATSPLRPEARDAMLRALEHEGNASSVHAEGRAARSLVEKARESVAAFIGTAAKNVIFTSGGTEANNMVLCPALQKGPQALGPTLLIGAAEHPSVLSGHRFASDATELVPVLPSGIIDLDWLEGRLAKEGRPQLVSIQLANNETGIVQPMAEISRLVHEYDGLVHSDAVQAFGKIPFRMIDIGADIVTLSAHKFGGPKGVGAVVFASAAIEIGERLMRGGGQERGFRAGTENVPTIAGFGAAVETVASVFSQETAQMRLFRQACERAVTKMAPEAVIFGQEDLRLPNTFTFAVPGWRAETALIAFDWAGVAVSSGSACSSGKVKRSHVLAAMGVADDLAAAAIRVSVGWNTSEKDVAVFAAACEKASATLH